MLARTFRTAEGWAGNRFGRDTRAVDANAVTKEARVATHTLTILTLDGGAEHSAVLQRAISRELPQWSLILASDVAQALSIAATRAPDVVVLDPGVRISEGLELARQVVADKHLREIPVIVTNVAAGTSVLVSQAQAAANCPPQTDSPDAIRSCEENLARQARETTAIFEGVPLALLLVDGDRRLLRLNRSASEFCPNGGDSLRGNTLGQSVRCIHAEEDPRGCGFGPSCPECSIRRAVAQTLTLKAGSPPSQTSMTLELGGRTETRHVILSTAYVETESGSRALVTLQDITERQAASEALSESERRFEQLVTRAGEGIGFVDSDERFQYVNPAAETIFGVPPGGLVGQRLEQFCSPESYRRVLGASKDRVQGKQGSFELEIRQPGGALRHIVVTAESSATREGQFKGTFGVFCDVTERKQSEANLRHAQKMESVGRLAGGIAHDFNNLLTVINGYACLSLSSIAPADPLRESLEEIRKAGERAALLTQQLLAFGRRQVMHPQVLDLKQIVTAIRPMLERLLGEDVLLVTASQDAPAMICADPLQIEQVLLTLAECGRTAMPTGGTLRIETSITAGHSPNPAPGRDEQPFVTLTVIDSGAGMDDETRKHIFEPFFTAADGRGAGLGLSMIQGVVEQSGGHIRVESEPGVGTTFRICFPPAEAAAAPVDPASLLEPASEKRTVLVVEDQPEVRRFAVAALHADGYLVLQAENAEEALLLCESSGGGIDLVLTDVVMPGVSGPEFICRLQKLRPGLKAIYMSGYAGETVEQYGVGREGPPLIPKPFTPEELGNKVREVLGRPARRARILIADDEAGVRRYLRTILEGAGYTVTEAPNGQLALEKARAGTVDLVITDLVMPEREGIETIQILRKTAPEIGIVAISGAFGGQFLQMAKMLGAQAVLSKPVSAELLLAKVAEVLNR
jgi:PAS domain S-box-containing protein